MVSILLYLLLVLLKFLVAALPSCPVWPKILSLMDKPIYSETIQINYDKDMLLIGGKITDTSTLSTYPILASYSLLFTSINWVKTYNALTSYYF